MMIKREGVRLEYRWDLALTFLSVVEKGGLMRKDLGIPRQTLSDRIVALNQAFGTPLLHTTKNGYVLTPTGKLVQDCFKGTDIARKFLEIWRDAVRAANHNVLSIAATGVAIRAHLPGPVREWSQTNQKIPIVVSRHDRADIPKLIADGLFRFGIASMEPKLDGLHYEPYIGTELQIAYPAGRGPYTSATAINDELGWVMPVPSAEGRGRSLLMKLVGGSPRIIAEVGNYDDAAAFAAAGVGATFCSSTYIVPYLAPPRTEPALEVLSSCGLTDEERFYPGALIWTGRKESSMRPWEDHFRATFLAGVRRKR